MAWLLLLLAEGESYGRALIVDLSGRGIRADSPFVYRTLRGLEQERAISSRWARSAHGPRRRAYRITRKGRRILGELGVDIAAACELHKTFLRAHEHAQSAGDAGGGQHLALGELREPPTRQNAGSDNPSQVPAIDAAHLHATLRRLSGASCLQRGCCCCSDNARPMAMSCAARSRPTRFTPIPPRCIACCAPLTATDGCSRAGGARRRAHDSACTA